MANRTIIGFGVLILVAILGLMATMPGTPVWGLLRGGKTVVIPPSADATRAPREYTIRTVLGRDAIPAILNPTFVEGEEADVQLRPDDLVIGLSINGDTRAYSIAHLSSHEVVNDTVGGVPVVITW